MTPDPIAYRARGNAAEAAYTGATTMTQERRFTAAEFEAAARIWDPVYPSMTDTIGDPGSPTTAAMLRQAAADAAIVEQLPLTTDGQRIIPGVTRVWINPGEPGGFFYDAGYAHDAPPIEVKVGACWGDHFWFNSEGHQEGDHWAGKSWSTRAAAQKAAK